MKQSVYERHERLQAFPPVLLLYILYRRLVEHGVRPTWLWIQDKIARRLHGYSPPRLSQVAPNLYVGGQHTTRGLEAMRARNIRAVVNMREESDDAARRRAPEHYLYLPTTDDAAPAIEALHKGASFIKTQIEQGRGVYVHCASGVGRAPTMAAAYLVREGADPQEAWALLKEGRPFIRPTPPQLAVVQSYAALCRRNERGASARSDPGPHAAVKHPLPQAVSAQSEADVPTRRFHKAFERITGDPGLTGDLTDEEARMLMQWARAEVRSLVDATASMDETQAWERLDPQLATLRRHLRTIVRKSAASENTQKALQANLSSPAYPDIR